ncbi:MAG TPA: PH domain-containing protein [Panacibacter sp.]|nr:PH domain-containing protein [Panacibacter sp.]
MKIFKSRIGPELLFPISIILVGLIILAAYEKNWAGFILTLVVVLFFIHLYASTSYTIKERILIIKCSIFYHQSITVDTIKTITKVTDIFSAPAFSVKRLLICFNDTGNAVISPKDESGFIRLLTELNPKISVQLKS